MQEYPSYAETITHYLSILTILGAMAIVFVAVTIGYLLYKNDLAKYGRYLGDYIFPIGFFVSFGGMMMSLFYSEVLHYAPCDLCWYQRIFLYPQAFMFAYAWYKKDRAILPYALILSGIGFAIASYHHMLQIGFDLMKPCSSAPFAVDCAKPSFVEFGFVTFPFMSAVLFGFMIIVITTALYRKENNM